MVVVNRRWKFISKLMKFVPILMVTIAMTSCHSATATAPNLVSNVRRPAIMLPSDGPIGEVNTPTSIVKLAPNFDRFQPQVKILNPQPDEILTDDRVSVRLQVTDLPIFKQPDLGLGPHLHLILDQNTYQGVYDLSQPIEFDNLTPGTHTLRVFASRPWHESFKNDGAYAQTTFHVLTTSQDHNPDPKQPLLTYSRPVGTYSAEPIMLDFYLTNAPSHFVAKGSGETIPDWRVKVTINDQSFVLDRWAPIYLTGFHPGKNWVRLQLIDDRGNPIPNVYNDTISVVNYDPQTKDSLAKLIKGEISTNIAQSLVDPNYIVTKPVPAIDLPLPPPIVSQPVILPAATPSPIPSTLPSPITAISPAPISIPTPSITPLAPPVTQEIVPSPTPNIE